MLFQIQLPLKFNLLWQLLRTLNILLLLKSSPILLTSPGNTGLQSSQESSNKTDCTYSSKRKDVKFLSAYIVQNHENSLLLEFRYYLGCLGKHRLFIFFSQKESTWNICMFTWTSVLECNGHEYMAQISLYSACSESFLTCYLLQLLRGLINNLMSQVKCECLLLINNPVTAPSKNQVPL